MKRITGNSDTDKLGRVPEQLKGSTDASPPLSRTRDLFQSLAGESITSSVARQIQQNVLEFSSVLSEWRKKRQAENI